MSFRRSLTFAAALVAGALALTSCAAASASDDGITEIDFYYPIQVGGPLEEIVNGYIDEFNETHEDIEVTPVYSGDYDQTLAAVQSAAQAGNTPAVTVLMSTDLLTLHDSGIMTPIGDIVDDEEWFSSFYEPFMANSTLPDGTVGSIPFQRSTVVMYWNKELFEAAGLDPETPPTTWDEMVAFGKKVQQDGGAQWGVQLPSTTSNVWILESMVIQNGSLLWDHETGTDVNYDDPATITALENWVQLQEEGLEPEGTVDWGTLPTEFANGDTGIIWTTTGQLSNIRDNADFEFGVAALPAQKQPGSPTGGGNLYIMSGLTDAEQAAAVELTRFLSSPEIQSRWGVDSGYVAPLEAAWEMEPLAGYAEDFPQAGVARGQLDVAQPELGVHRRVEVQDIMSNVIQQAMGGGDVPSMLAEAQQQADRVLEEYR